MLSHFKKQKTQKSDLRKGSTNLASRRQYAFFSVMYDRKCGHFYSPDFKTLNYFLRSNKSRHPNVALPTNAIGTVVHRYGDEDRDDSTRAFLCERDWKTPATTIYLLNAYSFNKKKKL